MRLIDLTGRRFGTLVVLGRNGSRPMRGRGGRMTTRPAWLVQCDCGKTLTVSSAVLPGQKTCGHLKHGCARRRRWTPEYQAWKAMLSRCLNPKTAAYHRYGGRGVTVCQEWLGDFRAFLAHVGLRPTPKHSLDRINNNGNYEPGNVRWATKKEQANNRSTCRALRAASA